MQIACYELRKQALEGRDGGPEPVSRAETDASVSRIAEHLREIGFFKVSRDRDLSAFLRDTVERAAYTPKELRYFESIFRKAAGMIHQKIKEQTKDFTTETRREEESTEKRGNEGQGK